MVAFAVDNGLAASRRSAGIPGTAGAGPIQNIGAYGQQLSDTLVAIDFLDYDSGEVVTLAAAELEPRLPHERAQARAPGVVLSIELELRDDGRQSDRSRTRSSRRRSASSSGRASRSPTRAPRFSPSGASKGMVLEPGGPGLDQRGILLHQSDRQRDFARTPSGRRAALPDRAGGGAAHPAARLRDPAADGRRSGEYQVKLSAAWLIERAGIERGFALPGSGAAISTKHTLAIVNRGAATAADDRAARRLRADPGAVRVRRPPAARAGARRLLCSSLITAI